VTYHLEWRLIGRENRLLDQGEIDGGYADRASALQALNAFLLTFALRGRCAQSRHTPGTQPHPGAQASRTTEDRA